MTVNSETLYSNASYRQYCPPCIITGMMLGLSTMTTSTKPMRVHTVYLANVPVVIWMLSLLSNNRESYYTRQRSRSFAVNPQDYRYTGETKLDWQLSTVLSSSTR